MSKHQPEETTQKLKRKKYEKELRKLQAELCRLQDWVGQEGLRVIVLFEGRDAAGKDGTIKALMERVSPRCGAAGPVRPREDPALCATLHPALPGRRGNRHLRPQLVQPNRR
jgi:polyphosphate kinase 2 (PPK2 family)